MPAKTVWFMKIPEILEQLEAFDVPVLDRAMIEKVFGLGRRQSIELLHRVGGYQAGRTFLVDRHRLIEYLRRLADGEEFLRESRRRERLGKTLDEMRRHQAAARIKIPVPPDVFDCNVADLSKGVRLEPGHLNVEFTSALDLLGKLYELSQAAANDFDRFRAAVEPTA